MGVGVFSWRHEREMHGVVVAWFGKRGGGEEGKVCMGDTWVLALALGGESKRGREGGIGVQGFGRSGVFLLCALCIDSA